MVMERPNLSPKVTRRDVDSWLAQIQHQIETLLRGPAGELRARLVLLHKRVSGWRDLLQVRRSGERRP
ncbi:MAG: hypothetical protein JSW71_21470 [Gemmatimonadota bacterium]|nr:MAG: hypothetical protein JSW71_21470 [Gemmatimonadota bacterium]